MALVKNEVQSHPASRYLLISAEYRTNGYVEANFGFAPPANVTLRYASALDAEALARADSAILIVDPRNHHPPYDRQPTYARQFAALRLRPLFGQGNVRVFKTDDLARLASLGPLANSNP